MASHHLGFLHEVSSPETFYCRSLQSIMAQAQASGLLFFLALDLTNVKGLELSTL